MKGKDKVTLTTEQMELNGQCIRKKYQESKTEPIMAADEVLHCGLVNTQSLSLFHIYVIFPLFQWFCAKIQSEKKSET